MSKPMNNVPGDISSPDKSMNNRSKPINKGKRPKCRPGNRNDRTGNDVSWYKYYPDLFDQATEIQQFYVSGKAYDMTCNGVVQPMEFPIVSTGIFTYTFDALAGICQNANDPLNKATIMLFNILRGRYTSNVPFQPNDLGAMILAFGSVLTVISDIKRSLRWLEGTYPLENANMPYVLFNSHGLEYTNERRQLAANLFDLNVAIKRLNAVCLPGQFSYFAKSSWISKYVYLDDYAGQRGNYFYYKPGNVFIYSPTVPVVGSTTAVASGLKWINYGRLQTISSQIAQLNAMIDALVDDDNIRQISGWIRDKYEGVILTGADIVDRSETIPEHNEEVVMQIRNMTLIKAVNPTTDVIKQDPETQCLVDTSLSHNVVLANGTIPVTNKDIAPTTFVLNFSDKADKDKLMEGSRFTCGYRRDLTQSTPTFRLVSDTYGFTNIEYWYLSEETGVDNFNIYNAIDLANNSTNPSDKVSLVINEMKAPVLLYEASTEGNITYCQWLVESQFSFTVNLSSLDKLHQVAVLSQFNLPVFGK